MSVLEVQVETTVLETGEIAVEIFEVGVQGPPGPPGSGAAATIHEQSVLITTSGPQTITLDFAPTAQLEWFINGIKNPTSLFVLTGTTITIAASVGLEPGDLLTFSYAI